MPFVPKNKQKTAERGYGGSHQAVREKLLKLYPVCQLCDNAFSEHLHHVNHNAKDRRPVNLLMVCRRCHGDLHADR